MESITPYLWFDDQAEEAANFYVSTFSRISPSRDTRVVNVSHYDEAASEAAGRPLGSVMTVTFHSTGWSS